MGAGWDIKIKVRETLLLQKKYLLYDKLSHFASVFFSEVQIKRYLVIKTELPLILSLIGK